MKVLGALLVALTLCQGFQHEAKRRRWLPPTEPSVAVKDVAENQEHQVEYDNPLMKAISDEVEARVGKHATPAVQIKYIGGARHRPKPPVSYFMPLSPTRYDDEFLAW